MVGVSVISYGIGNVQSIVNALRRAGGDIRIAENGAELVQQSPEHIVLPGVGAAGQVLSNLRELGFEEALNTLVLERETPFLGVCVGLQVLFDTCEEFGEHNGFGWLPGRVTRMDEADSRLRLPHVGWNEIEPAAEDALFDGLEDRHLYFLHSYSAVCDSALVLARAVYGSPFVAAVRKDHIAAVQFHPEKSSDSGERILANFLGS